MRQAAELSSFCAVLRLKTFAKYWLPLLLWMLLIFGASADTGSAPRSSRIIGPIMHWLFPQMPEPDVERIVFWVRKAAHFTEFGIMAFLLWRAIRRPRRTDPVLWSPSAARWTLLLVVLYAVSDEVHQRFVPTRQGSVWDVLIDSSGAVAGLVVTALVCRWLERRRRNVASAS